PRRRTGDVDSKREQRRRVPQKSEPTKASSICGNLVENVVQNICYPCAKTMNYWDQLRNYLQTKVSTQEYDNWLRGTAFAGLQDGTLSLAVPTRGPGPGWGRGNRPLFRQASGTRCCRY